MQRRGSPKPTGTRTTEPEVPAACAPFSCTAARLTPAAAQAPRGGGRRALRPTGEHGNPARTARRPCPQLPAHLRSGGFTSLGLRVRLQNRVPLVATRHRALAGSQKLVGARRGPPGSCGRRSVGAVTTVSGKEPKATTARAQGAGPRRRRCLRALSRCGSARGGLSVTRGQRAGTVLRASERGLKVDTVCGDRETRTRVRTVRLPDSSGSAAERETPPRRASYRRQNPGQDTGLRGQTRPDWAAGPENNSTGHACARSGQAAGVRFS